MVIWRMSTRECGSSPLTRGKLRRIGVPWCNPGLIPAHAGKTFRRVGVADSRRAHPRSRGENNNCAFTTVSHVGSSPLTRGKLDGGLDCVKLRGLIPAHAGKTQPEGSRKMITRAHPRSRGENTFPAVDAITRAGSSPLTRGKPDRAAGPGQVVGLIPAHAGKTASRSPRPYPGGAHPRSRGENLLLVLPSGSVQGSSPLTRGKPRPSRPPPRPCGLIPAHAGKTVAGDGCFDCHGAHPRSRGENTSASATCLNVSGSSPLTRGKREVVADVR